MALHRYFIGAISGSVVLIWLSLWVLPGGFLKAAVRWPSLDRLRRSKEEQQALLLQGKQVHPLASSMKNGNFLGTSAEL